MIEFRTQESDIPLGGGDGQSRGSRAQQFAAALSLMRKALAILDESKDADTSGVHLSLAIERLRDLME